MGTHPDAKMSSSAVLWLMDSRLMVAIVPDVPTFVYQKRIV